VKGSRIGPIARISAHLTISPLCAQPTLYLAPTCGVREAGFPARQPSFPPRAPFAGRWDPHRGCLSRRAVFADRWDSRGSSVPVNALPSMAGARISRSSLWRPDHVLVLIGARPGLSPSPLHSTLTTPNPHCLRTSNFPRCTPTRGEVCRRRLDPYCGGVRSWQSVQGVSRTTPRAVRGTFWRDCPTEHSRISRRSREYSCVRISPRARVCTLLSLVSITCTSSSTSAGDVALVYCGVRPCIGQSLCAGDMRSHGVPLRCRVRGQTGEDGRGPLDQARVDQIRSQITIRPWRIAIVGLESSGGEWIHRSLDLNHRI
jgi:hypothetical protein